MNSALSFRCTVFLIVASMLSSSLLAFGQDEEVQSNNEEQNRSSKVRNFRINATYPPGIRKNYKITESTTVQRILPVPDADAIDTIEYQRNVEYYLTLRNPGEKEEGFLSISTRLDSMRYSFVSPEKKVSYYSQTGEISDPNFPDYHLTTASMNREFEVVYSSYNDIAKIGGSGISALRAYLEKEGDAFQNEVQRYVWYEGISKPALAHISDIQRNMILPGKFYEDSVWHKTTLLRANGHNLQGTAEHWLADYSEGTYTLKSKCDSLTAESRPMWFFNFDTTLLEPQEVTGSGSYEMKINRFGTIHSVVGRVNAIAVVESEAVKFTENISSTISIELTGQWQW